MESEKILHAKSKVTLMPVTNRKQFCKRHQRAWLNHLNHHDQTAQKTWHQGVEAAELQTWRWSTFKIKDGVFSILANLEFGFGLQKTENRFRYPDTVSTVRS
ncbi:hypothetical protein M8J77_012376 [Diaphorina citri]|nr:hypothetical protein M8J77_012376 [Diaphorina citri]